MEFGFSLKFGVAAGVMLDIPQNVEKAFGWSRRCGVETDPKGV